MAGEWSHKNDIKNLNIFLSDEDRKIKFNQRYQEQAVSLKIPMTGFGAWKGKIFSPL